MLLQELYRLLPSSLPSFLRFVVTSDFLRIQAHPDTHTEFVMGRCILHDSYFTEASKQTRVVSRKILLSNMSDATGVSSRWSSIDFSLDCRVRRLLSRATVQPWSAVITWQWHIGLVGTFITFAIAGFCDTHRLDQLFSVYEKPSAGVDVHPARFPLRFACAKFQEKMPKSPSRRRGTQPLQRIFLDQKTTVFFGHIFRVGDEFPLSLFYRQGAFD